jgi:hypothetical protein
MKRQFLAIGLATISALGTFSAIDPVSAQTPVQSHTIEVRVDTADAAPVAFDPGNAIEARPDMFVRVFVDGERIAFSTAPKNQSSVKFGVRASGRSTKSLVPVRVELYDKDDNAQEGIDINPLGGLKILNLRYNPATGEILNEQGTPVAQRDRAFDMEGLGDGEKKATIRFSIAHK